MKRTSIIFIILISLLSACSEEEETVEIEDKNFANTLYVQKIENNFSSKELTKPIENQEQIEEVLSKVEGLQAERISNDEFIQKLENQDNYYRFGFVGQSGSDVREDQYAFQIMKDGTILFNFDQINNPTHSLITVTTHEELLEELKEELGIKF